MPFVPEAHSVRSFASDLRADLGHRPVDDLLDLIGALEELKNTACAMQAEATATFDAARKADRAAAGVPARDQGRGIAHEVASARQESPRRGQSLVGLAKALTRELPHTLERMQEGSLSEFRATLIARETACLSVDDRLTIDHEVCADRARLEGTGTRRLLGRVKRLVAQRDPAAVVQRCRRAEGDRHVSLRPAPDAMTYLTALLPVTTGVAAYAALGREADALRATGDERSRGQAMADLLVTQVTGVTDTGDPANAPAVPVAVNLTMPASALAGRHDAAEARAPGVATDVLPAEVARHLVARAADAGITAWFRQIYTSPTGGLVAMSSRQRCFPDGLAEFLTETGGGICATPWCDAPIRHIDHIVPIADGGATNASNGQGLCEACNYAKQTRDWQHAATGPPQRMTNTAPQHPQPEPRVAFRNAPAVDRWTHYRPSPVLDRTSGSGQSWTDA